MNIVKYTLITEMVQKLNQFESNRSIHILVTKKSPPMVDFMN